MPIENDPQFDKLITEVSSLFNNKQQFNQPEQDSNNPESSEFNKTSPQAPIKGTYACSGVFGSGDARHKGIHNGVDLRAPGGTSVYPLLPGIVSSTGYSSKGGNNIVIKHNNGITTYYAHLGTIVANKGDKVNYDTIIGTIGDSGNAKGTMPHLHFEVSKNGTKQNPNTYFKVPAYTAPTKEEKYWLSDEHKMNAKSFNINNHLQNRRLAFSNEATKLLKFAYLFSKIIKCST